MNKNVPKAKQKRFKGKAWPSPRTALDELKRRAQVAAAEARRQFESMFEFVPQEQWEHDMAHHEASFGPDPAELSHAQRQRMQAAGIALPPAAPSPAASPSVVRGGLGVPAPPDDDT